MSYILKGLGRQSSKCSRPSLLDLSAKRSKSSLAYYRITPGPFGRVGKTGLLVPNFTETKRAVKSAPATGSETVKNLLSSGKCKPRDTVMNSHEKESSRVEAMQLGTEHPSAAHAPATNPTSSLAHYITDAAQLEALIKEKAQAELEFAVRIGELKVLFPCPSSAAPTKTRTGLTRFDLNKKDQQSPQFCRQHLSWIRNRKNPILLTKIKKRPSTPKAETNNKNPAKHAFAGLAIDEPEIVATDKTAQVADLSLKIKPVMLMYNKNLVLQELNKKFPK
ncbi:hypothetical protein TNIN_104731 [Trichonephila inaurata madagascariensis]|uniref:Uncharacterized protein n=1 Tax=Trichonephila inaurata madagascariensis TaxID=2747483 RepID=A0A8X7BWJ4_9ARAC|nr:hypothetical protein TNIN_104731 [Trichonephila inaurata madagascariensis]